LWQPNQRTKHRLSSLVNDGKGLVLIEDADSADLSRLHFSFGMSYRDIFR
jgi:hypothetical protein